MKHEFEKIKDAFQKLNFILTREQKKYSVIVFVMSMVAAVLEMLGVSIIIPLIQAFVSIDTLAQQPYIVPFVEIFHLETMNEIIVFVCVSIIVIYIIKNLYSAFYIWVSNKFSCKIMRELSVRILSTYMKQGYSFFVNNNSARLLRGLGADVSSVYTVISQTFNFISKVLTILCISLFIVMETPGMAIYLIVLVVVCFTLTQLIFRKPMQKYGKSAREYTYKCNQASLEAIQGSKEVLVTNRQNYFINQYRTCMEGANRSSIRMAIGATVPAYLIEAVCITGLMLAVAIQMINSDNAYELLGQMAMIAVAAFRILPSLGGMLSAVNSLVYNAPGLNAAYETLAMVRGLEDANDNDSLQREGEKEVKFENELTLSHVTFSYPNSKEKVIDDLSMTIKKGTSVAFIGTSGAGKTTLSDIILALLKPQSGEILMDGMNIEDLGGTWNKIIGYVPQSVYMTDSSIRRNIAFGIEEEKIDDDKVWQALEMAQLKDFVKRQPIQLDSMVGEWGVKFSGGQRQRIAIARALYGEPDILVLDEATAALDTETETAVMESIEALQGYKTLIIVAHRLTTIRNCDVIYEIKDGKAIRREKNEIFSDISEG